MALITLTKPKYATYQASPEYLDLLGIKDYLFLNIDSSETSIPLIKSFISNTSHFDLITPINFQESLNYLNEVELHKIYQGLRKTSAICCYVQTKNSINHSSSPLINTEHYRTNYFFNLTLSLDELRKNKKRDARQRLNKAIKSTCYTISEDIVSSEFHLNYHRISVTNSFSNNYLFSPEQFSGFSKLSGIKYLELRKNDTFLSGGFFGFNQNNDVDYLYGANSLEMSDSIRLLIWEAMKYFKQKGFRRLFLGGGISENDNLAQFKLRLGTQEHRCQIIKGVLNCDTAVKLANRNFSNEWFDSFFPPYKQA